MPTDPKTLVPEGFALVRIKPRKKGFGIAVPESTERIIESWVDHMLQSRPVKRPTRGDAITRAADALAAVNWMPGDRLRRVAPKPGKIPAGSTSPIPARDKPPGRLLRRARRSL